MQPTACPRRGRRTRVTPFARAVLVAFAVMPAPAAHAASDPADSARAIWARGERDSAHAFLDTAIVEARASDAASLAELLRLQGAMYDAVGFADRAIPFLEEALVRSQAAGDSVGVAGALRWLANARAERGELEESGRLARRWRACAEAADLALSRDRAMSQLGWIAMQRNRNEEARRMFEELLPDVRGIAGRDARQFEALVSVDLGNALISLGRYADARATLETACTIAEPAGSLFALGLAQNDLGFLSFFFGDLDVAAAHFQAAAETQRRDANDRAAVGPLMNRALVEAYRGRYDAARTRMRECVDFCDAHGFRREVAFGWRQLAEIRLSVGDPEGALGEFLRARNAFPGARPAERARIVGGEVEALLAAGRIAAADSAASAGDSSFGALAGVDGLQWTLTWARTRRKAADPGAAVARLVDAVERARSGGLRSTERRLLHELAVCELARGRRAAALVRFEEAAAAWEAERRTPRDPVWDEQATADAHALFEDWIDAVLAADADGKRTTEVSGERAVRAWSILQRYKARTLLERIRAPGDSGEAEPTMSPPPEEVLRDDETFLDLLLGGRRAFVFVADRSGVRVARRDSVQVDAFRNACREASDDLLTGSDPPLETVDVLARFLADGERLAPAIRIVSPDGPADVVPWEGLNAPDGRPFAAFRVPSAAFLARVRERRVASGDGVTVIEGDVLPDGTALEGARKEARALRRMLAEVRIVRRLDLDSLAGSPPRVLHVAAHTVVDDAVPWRSGIYLPGAVGDEAVPPPDPWLRADRIARVRIPAELVVLSGCDTAGGAVVSGEGVQGLATAFLAAGAPVVVASLGGVEDRAMATAIERFYAELARGRTIANALERARKASSGAEARALMHLAIVGDGARTIQLRRRRGWAVPAAGVLALFGVLGWTWIGLRRSRRSL